MRACVRDCGRVAYVHVNRRVCIGVLVRVRSCSCECVRECTSASVQHACMHYPFQSW